MMAARINKSIPFTDLVRSETAENDKGCWVWQRMKNRKGYARIRWNGKIIEIHRMAYEAFIGPIPEGLVIDHLCRNPSCLNPEHLEAVTHKENTLRGNAPSALYAKQTHCKHGHPLSGANLRVEKDGGRTCKTCNREAVRRYKARKVARAAIAKTRGEAQS